MDRYPPPGKGVPGSGPRAGRERGPRQAREEDFFQSVLLPGGVPKSPDPFAPWADLTAHWSRVLPPGWTLGMTRELPS